MMNKIFALMLWTLAATVVSFSQPPVPDESMRLCNADLKAGKFEAAVTSCTAAIKKSPNKHEGYQGRAFAYFNLKNNDAALSDFTKAVSLAPNNIELLGLRGEFYIITKKNDLALADLNKVIKLSPKHLAALFRRSQIYNETGKRDLAIADLKAILAIDPSLTEAKGALAILEPPTVKAPQYRSDKFKVAFQIPTDSTKQAQSTEIQPIFAGDRAKFGPSSLLSFVGSETKDAEAASKTLATDEGMERLSANLIQTLRNDPLNTGFTLVEKKRIQIAGLNGYKVIYSTRELNMSTIEYEIRRTAIHIVPVPAQNRVYLFTVRANDENFAKWSANVEKSINSFEILK